VVTGDPSDQEKIDILTAEALAADEEIARLAAEVDDVHKAMEHRADIEQAKGVIMHSMGCSAHAAFAVLVAASQRENVRLRDVAARIVASQQTNSD
jgi:AmiR/NasT family two-component response regulator